MIFTRLGSSLTAPNIYGSDSSHRWLEQFHFNCLKMPSEQSKGNYGKRTVTKLADYCHIRHQGYAAVNILLISWKDDDTNSATEIKQLQTLFQESFNYTVCLYQFPSIDSQASLNFQIASFLLASGGPNNLLIIYYGGHGGPRTGQSKSPCT